MTFTTKLEIFEGPLDLLLHLIKINEVEISDIPIATITDQYLEYLDLMKALDINIAGDFLVMASTLMHIKSKMLLPKQEDDLAEIEDPREEIVRSLTEYMQLKDAANELASRDILYRDVFKRGIEMKGGGEDITTTKVTLYDLMDDFKKVIRKKHPDIVLKFNAESWSIKKKMIEIIRILNEKKNLLLGDLFSTMESVSEMIATFLALLELIRTGFVNVFQGRESSDIMLEAINEKT
ncbi:MAG: chromosome segregation protein ScpA [Deltaproteobacteria bacterium]|nr:MAG: chromosome segregation protein ScpA [Deltaproteobacteria bacterium]